MKNKRLVFLAEIATFVSGFVLGGKMFVSMINEQKRQVQRNLSNMMLLNDWIDFLYGGGNIEQYFHKHDYKRIMIYGNGYIGRRLYQALEDTDIDVVAIMDKMNAAGKAADSMLIGTDSAIPDIDCVVITPVFYFNEIYKTLSKKTQNPIISIEELWQIKE